MTIQIDELILRTKGEDELRRLKGQLDNVDEGLRRSIQQFGAHDATTRLLAARYQGLTQQIQATEASIARYGGATGALTQSISTLSFTLNDAQQFSMGFDQGMRAIGNNLPGLTDSFRTLREVGVKGVMTALAGPAGLILGLTAVSSVVPIIYANWDKLRGLWGSGETQTEAERMDQLAKATKRTVEETDKLTRYRREQSTLERLTEGEPKEVRKSREAAEKAVIEAGFPDVATALVTARNQAGLERLLPEADRREIEANRRVLRSMREYEGPLAPLPEEIERFAGESATFEREAIDRVRDQEIKRARGDVSKALNNAERFQSLLTELRGAGGRFPDLAEDLAQTTPEARRAKQVAERIENVTETLSGALEKARETIGKRAEEIVRTRAALSEATAEVEAENREAADKARNDELKRQEDIQKGRGRQAEIDRRAIEQATESFASGAGFEILRGDIDPSIGRRDRRAHLARIDEQIRREAEAQLIERGEPIDRAAELARQAPRQLREDLNRRMVALQARGLGAQQAQQVLVGQLLGDISRLEARLGQIEMTTARQHRQRQQVVTNSQNRGR